MTGKMRFSIVFSVLFLMAGVALAGWHGEDDIQNLEGITGTYTWFDETMVPASIQFTEKQIHGAVDGTYRIFQACWEFSWDEGWHQEECEIETGSFHSVGNNPAIACPQTPAKVFLLVSIEMKRTHGVAPPRTSALPRVRT